MSREKLVELLRQCVTQNMTTDPDIWGGIVDVDYGGMADHLLANGVIVLPCNVGDTVWFPIEFTVIDNKTGAYPDCEKIALTEEWAKHLCYCDIDCFAITEDGALILIDDCGRMAYCPAGRFTVTIDPEELRPKGRWEVMYKTDEYTLYGHECGWRDTARTKYCPNCGAKMTLEEIT